MPTEIESGISIDSLINYKELNLYRFLATEDLKDGGIITFSTDVEERVMKKYKLYQVDFFRTKRGFFCIDFFDLFPSYEIVKKMIYELEIVDKNWRNVFVEKYLGNIRVYGKWNKDIYWALKLTTKYKPKPFKVGNVTVTRKDQMRIGERMRNLMMKEFENKYR